MLSVYTRHYPPCGRHDIHYRRCHCPKWIRGTLEDIGFIRRSARSRSWAKAELKARALKRKSEHTRIYSEGAANTIARESNTKECVLIKRAVDGYLDDERARKLQPATIHQKRAFLVIFSLGVHATVCSVSMRSS